MSVVRIRTTTGWRGASLVVVLALFAMLGVCLPADAATTPAQTSASRSPGVQTLAAQTLAAQTLAAPSTARPAQLLFGGSWLRNASYPAPPGSNSSTCRPSAAKPYPVILVHGLLLKGSTTWGTMSPNLANQGYCVYSIDYGQTLVSGGALVQNSAQQLSESIDDVLARTGATKVLIVAHSLGGIVSRYYLDKLGGAAKTTGLVSLAAPHQGTTQVAFVGISLAMCPACLQVLVGSPLLTSLNSQSQALKPRVKYTQIATAYFDEFVIPAQNSFLPSAPGQSVNLWLSDGCGTAITGHILMPSHPVTMELVSLALANGGLGKLPSCGATSGP